MQVLIEGVALAAFGLLRDMTPVALLKQILAYVMQDEARHVAFGRLALRDYYRHLSAAELAERDGFVVEGCYLLRDRFTAEEVWRTLGYDVADCLEAVDKSTPTSATSPPARKRWPRSSAWGRAGSGPTPTGAPASRPRARRAPPA